TLSEGNNARPVVDVLTADKGDLSQRMLDIGDKNKRSLLSPQWSVDGNLPPQQFSQNGADTALINVFDSLQNNASTGLGKARMARGGIMARDNDNSISSSTIVLGNSVKARVNDSVIIGIYSKAIYYADEEKLKTILPSVTAIGYSTSALDSGAVAVGANAYVKGIYGVGVGMDARVVGDRSIAIGHKARAESSSGVALGSNAVADVGAGVAGYVPIGKDIKGDKGVCMEKHSRCR
ncbi:hypothetical protein, partial [Bartonella tribocorum]